jgi:hypothetical protein
MTKRDCRADGSPGYAVDVRAVLLELNAVWLELIVIERPGPAGSWPVVFVCPRFTYVTGGIVPFPGHTA